MTEYKENHKQRVELANYVTKEQAINEADIKVLTLDKVTLQEDLKKSQDNEELARLLLGPDHNLGQHFRKVADLFEKRSEKSLTLASKAIDDTLAGIKTVLSLNSKLMIENKNHCKNPAYGTRGEIVEHPLEVIYEQKFDRLKARVCLLMGANLDLGQRVADSMITEKKLKSEVDNLRSQLKPGNNQSQPGHSTRERLLREQQADIMSPEVDYLCQTLVDLQLKVDDTKENLTKKQQEVQKLDKRHGELQQSITDMLAYESDLGYDRMKEFTREQANADRKLIDISQRNSELEQIVKTLEYDQENKIMMIERMAKESKLLLFLNHKLAEELNDANPESCSYIYSRQFFRKNKMASADQEVLLTVEEVYTSDTQAKQRCFDLSQRVVSQADQINKLEKSLNDRDCIIADLSKELEMIKTRTNLLEKNEEKNEGEIYELIETLNSSIMSGENSKLKEEMRRLVDMNNSLNLAVLDRDVEIAQKSRTIENLQEELINVADMFQVASTELMELRSTKLKPLNYQNDLRKSENATMKRLNNLMKERLSAANENLKQISAFFKKAEQHTPMKVAPMVRSLMEEVKGILTLPKVDSPLDSEELMSKLWQQREETMIFKIEALMAYNSVLTNKCSGLEQALEEYFSRIQQLEKERASLEASTALEEVKNLMVTKEEQITKMTGRLEDMLSQQEEARRQEQEKWSRAVEQVRSAERESRLQFQHIEKEMKDKVDQVIDKCKSESSNVAQRCDALLKQKEEEISNLKSRLQGVEFEGRSEMISQVEQLLSQNYQLRKEVAQLEAANKISEINIGIIEEISEANTKLNMNTIEDELQKTKSAYHTTAKQKLQLEAAKKDDHTRWTARYSTLESKLAVSTSLVGELVESLKTLPESDQVKAVIESAQAKMTQLQKLT